MPQKLVAYIDGEFVPRSEAAISIHDLGYLMGDIVTESTRTFNMRPFKLQEHLDRLSFSLKATEIDLGMGLDDLEKATLELLERNRSSFGPDDDCWLVHNISRGIAPFQREPDRTYRPSTVVIDCYPIDFVSLAPEYEAGVHVIVPSTRQLPAESLDPKIKHRSRMHMNLAALEAEKIDPDAYPVMLDLQGNLSEGTGANFFIVSDGVVRTPGPRSVLRGVSRQTVLDLCQDIGVPSLEEDLQAYDALVADEAFLTSTPYCLVPVTRFNGQSVGDGVPGPVTGQLLDAWSELVSVDIVDQARRHVAS
jgi:branched-chain amino acid aminotransferase